MPSNRSLAECNHKLEGHSRVIEQTLSALVAGGRSRSVLEIGFGYGRALLELAWKFRDFEVEFVAINKERGAFSEGSDCLRRIAASHQLIPHDRLQEFSYPRLFFYDATRLHFSDESIDLIFSTVTMQFVERKAELVEEVCRVLKPGGVALLHLGHRDWNYPRGCVSPDPVLTPHASTWVLKFGAELIPIPEYIQAQATDAFRFSFSTTSRFAIQISKLASARLDLELEFDPARSMSMQKLPYRTRSGGLRKSFRSVYEVSPSAYSALDRAERRATAGVRASESATRARASFGPHGG